MSLLLALRRGWRSNRKWMMMASTMYGLQLQNKDQMDRSVFRLRLLSMTRLVIFAALFYSRIRTRERIGVVSVG